MKKKNRKNTLNLIFFICLILLTFFLIFRNTSFGSIKNTISQINPLFILAGIGLMIIYVFCEGECLRVICNSLGSKVGFGKAFVYACSDVYFSAITPSATGGQPAMIYYMSKDGIPISKSSLAVLLSLMEYMSVLVVLGILSFLCHFSFIMSNTLLIIMFLFGLIMSTLVIAASLAAMFSKTLIRRFALWCVRVLSRIRIIKDANAASEYIEKQLTEYRQGAQYIKSHPFISVRVLLICLLQRVSLLTVTYCVYKGMGISGASVISVLAMQSVVMLSVTSLPLPGAVGASEGMFMVSFAGIFPKPLLTSAMLLTRGINFYFNTLFAGTISLINHLRILRKDKKAAVKAAADTSE